MIHSTHRFHGRSSLRFVYSRGHQARGEFMGLRSIKNDRQKTWRVAVVVSRKVSKSAVVRNRIRRRIFESVRRHSGHINGAFDLVFNVYSEQLAQIDHQKIELTVVDLLQKSGVYTEPGSGPSHVIIENKETL
jgi:ribonuclease P protein component